MYRKRHSLYSVSLFCFFSFLWRGKAAIQCLAYRPSASLHVCVSFVPSIRLRYCAQRNSKWIFFPLHFRSFFIPLHIHIPEPNSSLFLAPHILPSLLSLYPNLQLWILKTEIPSTASCPKLLLLFTMKSKNNVHRSIYSEARSSSCPFPPGCQLSCHHSRWAP